jgi:xanthine dehydrogenase YagS FAD-binding subunit
MSVALSALDATVQVTGEHGNRSIPIHEFHRLPGRNPEADNTLRPGELITSVDLPAISYAKRSHYLKVRDRASYAFALVSVAAIIDLDEKATIREARIALGGVAHKPWRANKAEKALLGHEMKPERLRMAAEQELKAARPQRDNAFKIELAKRTMIRALMTAAKQEAA